MVGRFQCEGFEDEEAAASALGIRRVEDDQRYINWNASEALEIEHDIIEDDSALSTPANRKRRRTREASPPSIQPMRIRSGRTILTWKDRWKPS
jgi:hypothetical protein